LSRHSQLADPDSGEVRRFVESDVTAADPPGRDSETFARGVAQQVQAAEARRAQHDFPDMFDAESEEQARASLPVHRAIVIATRTMRRGPSWERL
jgi:hypothetical protein